MSNLSQELTGEEKDQALMHLGLNFRLSLRVVTALIAFLLCLLVASLTIYELKLPPQQSTILASALFGTYFIVLLAWHFAETYPHYVKVQSSEGVAVKLVRYLKEE